MIQKTEETMDSAKKQRMKTLDALLAGYGSMSVERLLEPLHSAFTHQVLPASLRMPAQNKDDFARSGRAIFDIFKAFRMVPKAVFHDAEKNTVVVEALMLGTFLRDGNQKEWRHECVLFVKFTEDGTQVLEIREFVDALKAVELKQRVAPSYFGPVDRRIRSDALPDDDDFRWLYWKPLN